MKYVLLIVSALAVLAASKNLEPLVFSADTYNCTSAGSFPDPEDTSKFYYCVAVGSGNYLSTLISCESGYEFDDITQQCMLPSSAKSSGKAESTDDQSTTVAASIAPSTELPTSPSEVASTSTEVPVSTEPPATPSTISDENESTTSQDEETTETTVDGPELTTQLSTGFACPGDGAFPDPNASNSFYFCFADGDGGYIPVRMQCSSGDIFDSNLSECVDTADSTGAPATVAPSFSCPSEGVFADPSDTTKFYYCFENPDGSGYRETVFTCPLGQVYDEDKKYCSVPATETTTTTTESSSSTEIASTTPTPFNCTRNGMFADPTNDQYFFICIFDGFGYMPISFQCSPGMVFIQDLYRCAPPDTPIPPPAPINCTSVGYYPDPDVCQTYYYCYSNFDGGYMALKMECPDGSSFFPNMQICVSDTVYNCKDGNSTVPETGTEAVSSSTNAILTTTTVAPPTTTTSGSSSGFHCTTSGLYPFPGNKRKYYACKVYQDGSVSVRVEYCWLGEEFSMEERRCVFSFNWWW